MSTRSYICRENEDGTYTGTYCHSDGYLTHNGALLIDHYRDREKVDKLLSLGSLSYLQPKIDPDPEKPHDFEYENRQEGVCVFYGRDQGEKDQQAISVRLEDINKDIWIEYCYVYSRDNEWKYFKPNSENPTIKLHDVEKDLNGIFKRYGIDRPPNEYGFFSNEEIVQIKAKQTAQKSAEM